VAGSVTVGTPPYTLWMLTNIFISTTPLLRSESGYGSTLPIYRPPNTYHPRVPRAVVHSFLLHVARKTKGFSISSIATIGQSVSQNGTMEHDTPFSRPVRSDGTLLPIFQSGRTRCQWFRMDVGFPLPQPSCCHVLFSLPRVLPSHPLGACVCNLGAIPRTATRVPPPPSYLVPSNVAERFSLYTCRNDAEL
jgi:hypothetical protein